MNLTRQLGGRGIVVEANSVFPFFEETEVEFFVEENPKAFQFHLNLVFSNGAWNSGINPKAQLRLLDETSVEPYGKAALS